MSQSNNNELSKSIIAIVAILGLVVIVEGFVLTMMYGGVGSNQLAENDASDPADITARIKPAMTLEDIRGGADTAVVAAPVVAAKSAKELYDTACMACHANGVAGAPKPGDKAAFEARYANGMDSLLASVVNGKGAMPAKGGSAYSDAELTLIIEYMLAESGLMDTNAAAPVVEEKAVEVAVTVEDDINTDVADGAADGDVAVEAAPMQAKAPVVEASSDVDLAAGEKNYRTACFACHDFGIAGAPKLGDAAGWVGRTDLEALTISAISGKGAMPAKGGAAYLSDEDVKNIVGFMLSKI